MHKKLPKSELLRIVKTEDGKISVDLKGKLKGRGANIIPEVAVFDQAIQKRMFERALKLGHKFSAAEVESLKKEFLDALEERKFRPKNKPVSIRVDKEDLKKIQS
jgi:hypothetical protein